MPKKRIHNKSTGRSYEYDQKYQSTPKQIANRVERNRARREVIEYLTDKYGKAKAMAMVKGKDVDHVKALKVGGSHSKKNRRLRSVSANRGDKKY